MLYRVTLEIASRSGQLHNLFIGRPTKEEILEAFKDVWSRDPDVKTAIEATSDLDLAIYTKGKLVWDSQNYTHHTELVPKWMGFQQVYGVVVAKLTLEEVPVMLTEDGVKTAVAELLEDK